MKKIFFLILSLVLLLLPLSACNKSKKEHGSFTYSVYDENDALIKANFTSLYAAIDEIGVFGKTGWKVKDTSGSILFERSQRNNLHLYVNADLKGTTLNTKEADTFIKQNQNAYVVNGLGDAYYGFSVKRMNSNMAETYGYEYHTGSYVYQFSAPGYIAAEQTVHLSRAKLRLSKNENIPYNAYFFINTNGSGGACDMGLTSADRHNGKVYLFSFGFGNGFNVHEDLGPVTEFVYNTKSNEYELADDVYMKYTMDKFGTYLFAKNLRTGEEFRCEELLANSEYKENYEATWNNRPILQSTSLVPDLKINLRKLWDPYCGAYLKNVEYSNLSIYKYGDDAKRDFYPSSADTYYGFAYAQGNSDFLEKNIENSKFVVHNIIYEKQF